MMVLRGTLDILIGCFQRHGTFPFVLRKILGKKNQPTWNVKCQGDKALRKSKHIIELPYKVLSHEKHSY